ncbi:MAG: BMC domain-containing protein [Fusobacterium sp.]|nr:BMC domain-containing protein [Fusobacterium sp.]
MKALGLIETKGITGAIAALDAALKTAQVELINRQKVKGGIVTIEIEGDVAAVKVAVDAGAAVAESLGTLLATHVIARPDTSIENILVKQTSEVKQEEIIEEVKEETTETTEVIKEEVAEEIEEIKEISKVSKKNKKNKK